MIPLSDYNPVSRLPFVTFGLMLACVWIFFVVQPGGDASVFTSAEEQQNDLVFNLGYAAIPCEVVQGRPLTVEEVEATFRGQNINACDTTPEGPAAVPNKDVLMSLVYSMFLHGGILHLLGNLLFLWVFGNNVEDRFGHLRYLAFYLLSGIVATVGHIAVQPASTLPLVGASGAVAGVMGAYLVLYPNVPVRSIIIIIVTDVRAKWFLGFWFVSQFYVNPNDGVAWMAHVAGFLFGILGGIWARRTIPAREEPEVVGLDDG